MVTDKATKNSNEGNLSIQAIASVFFFICLFVFRELADIVLAGMCTEAECLFVIYLCNSWLYKVILCSFFRVHCGSAERVVVVTGVWTGGWCPVFAHCVAHWTHRQVLNEGVLGYLGHPFFPYRKIINLVKKTKTELRLYYLQMLLQSRQSSCHASILFFYSFLEFVC